VPKKKYVTKKGLMKGIIILFTVTTRAIGLDPNFPGMSCQQTCEKAEVRQLLIRFHHIFMQVPERLES